MRKNIASKPWMIVGLALAFAACDSKEEEAESAGASEAEKAPAEEAEVQEKKEEEPTAAAEAVLGHDTLVAKGGDYVGKEVTVEAVSWGTSNMAGGGKRLNLGKEKLSGMRQAHLVADFPKEDTSVDGVEKDATVKMKCKVGKKAYGARQLEGCQIL